MTVEIAVMESRSRTDDLTACKNCGNYVTDTFRRVFGNNQNQLYGCLNCSTMRELRSGAGVRPD